MNKFFLASFLAAASLLFCSGCATVSYIAFGQCSEEQENIRITNPKVFGNIMLMDCRMMDEIQNGPDDYLLPPQLDRWLNTTAVCIDFPISFVFDVITFPYQLWRYYHLPSKTTGWNQLKQGSNSDKIHDN